jgi:hypothetical protein
MCKEEETGYPEWGIGKFDLRKTLSHTLKYLKKKRDYVQEFVGLKKYIPSIERIVLKYTDAHAFFMRVMSLYHYYDPCVIVIVIIIIIIIIWNVKYASSVKAL